METKYLTEQKLQQAAEILKRGGLLGIPTETVYGLGANGLNETAVANIFKAKGRPQDNPLILHIPDVGWLDRYFRSDHPPMVALPLSPAGTDFQCLVWEILLTIPYGTTRTYGDIAREAADRLGKARMSAQAVGGAVGRNPISIIIPCHRVIGTKGALTGYAGGLAKKEWLLRHEQNP